MIKTQYTKEYLEYCLEKTHRRKEFLLNRLEYIPHIKGYTYSCDPDIWFTYEVNQNNELKLKEHRSEGECIKAILNDLDKDIKSNSDNMYSGIPSYKQYIGLTNYMNRGKDGSSKRG
jgi:hypothetical protein